MEGEEEDCWGEVHQQVAEIKVEYLEFEEDIHPEILLALILVHLSLHFFKGEVAAVDPSFSLTHETVDGFDGIHLGIGIGHENDIFFVFVDTHAQNSVLSEIDVLVVENLLL